MKMHCGLSTFDKLHNHRNIILFLQDNLAVKMRFSIQKCKVYCIRYLRCYSKTDAKSQGKMAVSSKIHSLKSAHKQKIYEKDKQKS